MIKQSLALAALVLTGATQAAVIPVSRNFNAQGYDSFSFTVPADGIVDFQDTTTPAFDSLVSLFDEDGNHLYTGSDTSASDSRFHLTQDLEAGLYWLLVTVSDAGEAYFDSVGTTARPNDGINFGGVFYREGAGTLDGMKGALNAITDPQRADQAYTMNLGLPDAVPEPATYGLVALALAGLALTRRRAA